MPVSREAVPTPLSRALGFAGLIPFVAGASAILLGRDAGAAAFALLAYAATIVSFLGGVHWGPAMRGADPGQGGAEAFAWGVVPQLLGWFALLLPVRWGLVTAGAVLVFCYLLDRRRYPAAGLHGWLGLRLQLTIGAVASCWIGAVAV